MMQTPAVRLEPPGSFLLIVLWAMIWYNGGKHPMGEEMYVV